MIHLHAEPGGLAARLLPTAGLPLRLVDQVRVVLIAGALAGICLLGIRGRLRRDGETCPTARWRLLVAVCLCYLATCLALVLAR
jgi:hypothetical protein